MAVLDDLSGFEFEDVIEDVFRNLGYENVRQADRTADEGRDVLMEEVVDGTRRAIIVECKHTGTVGRPVVQKLHSAIATFDFDGPKRGMVVTTGRFTNPAQEYANRLQQNDDPHAIELLDGEDLREIADGSASTSTTAASRFSATRRYVPTIRPPTSTRPSRWHFATSRTHRERRPPGTTFGGDVPPSGRGHRGHERRLSRRRWVSSTGSTTGRGSSSTPNAGSRRSSTKTSGRWSPRTSMRRSISTPSSSEQCSTTSRRTGSARRRPSTKGWAVERLQQHHTTTVTYTGDNNVTYNKTCEPNRSDISVQTIEPVYLPEVRHTTDLQEYTYPYEYYAAGPSRVTAEDGIHRCVHCDTSGVDEPYTYCPNCGAISCDSHSKTERV